MSHTDTIAAVATPPGIGGIGVIRLSGTQSFAIAQELTQARLEVGKTQLRRFYQESGEEIDHGIILCFKAPHSFTGEDVVELQGHGGPVLQDMLLSRVCHLGARLAQAGEFSQRAFENDKLDLTQAEAIADLIESGSQAAARAAMRSLQGVFSDQVHDLVERVIELRSFIEAALDFAEEEIDFLAESDVDRKLADLISRNRDILQQAEKGRVLNEGMTLAIAGQPNAGKSSLLNHLAGYDAAIVTEIEGTTRDVIREHIALKGVPVHIIDTAGLRDSDDPVEQEGIRRAWQAIRQADQVLLLIDASKGIADEDLRIEYQLQGLRVRRVFTKSDVLADHSGYQSDLLISTRNGDGVDRLIDELTSNYTDYNHEQNTFMARRRHVESLKESLQALLNADDIFQHSRSGELMAEDLRCCQQALNQITGEFSNEDLLGKIFSSFCIGK